MLSKTKVLQRANLAIYLCLAAFLVIQAFMIYLLPENFVWQAGDSRQYWSIATHLLREGSYSDENESPTRMRQPGYPIFLAAVRAVAGDHIKAVQWVQALINVCTLFLLYKLTLEMGRRSTGLVTLGLSIAFAPLWAVSLAILSESFFHFWLFLGLFLLSRAMISKPTSTLLFWGAASSLAFAALTRPIGILLAPAIISASLLWVGIARPEKSTKIFRRLLVTLLVFVLWLTPWAIRNYNSMGVFTPFSSEGGLPLWISSLPNWQKVWDGEMAYAITLPEWEELRGNDYPVSTPADRRFQKAAIENIRGDPLGYVFRTFLKTLTAISYVHGLIEVAEKLGTIPRFAFQSGWVLLLVFNFVVLSVRRTRPILNGPSVIIVLTALVEIFLTTAPVATRPRHWLTVQLLIILLASLSLSSFFRIIFAKSRSPKFALFG